MPGYAGDMVRSTYDPQYYEEASSFPCFLNFFVWLQKLERKSKTETTYEMCCSCRMLKIQGVAEQFMQFEEFRSLKINEGIEGKNFYFLILL